MRGLRSVRCWTVGIRRSQGLTFFQCGFVLKWSIPSLHGHKNWEYDDKPLDFGATFSDKPWYGFRINGWGNYIQVRLTRSRADSVALRLRLVEDSHSCCTVTSEVIERKQALSLWSWKKRDLQLQKVHQVLGCSCVCATLCDIFCLCSTECTTTLCHPTTLRPVMIPSGSVWRQTCCLMGYLSAQSEPWGCRIKYQVFVILRKGRLWLYTIYTGWWFGIFFIFLYIGNNNPNWLIFFRGVETTNQYIYLEYTIFNIWYIV